MKETYEVGPGQTVTITVQVDDAPSTVLVPGERLYTNEEVAAAQASEAELVSKPLLARIRELEKELARRVTELEAEKNRADQNKAWAERAETEVDRLSKGHVCTARCQPNAHVAFTGRQRLEELEREVHDERERADRAEKAQEAGESAAVQLLSATLGRISGAVHTPALSDALRTTWQDSKAQAMRKAVREVRHLLGSPVPHQP
jgi:hypothetical protein